jgi:predicted acetyltransferase
VDIRTYDRGRGHKRELWVQDQAVAWLEIIDHQMRIGSAQVRMAGIGGVETCREHRKKGYMRELMEDSLVYMVEQGYDVSMLFGISDFYPKFGYAACLPSHKLVVQTRDAEDAGRYAATYTMRRIQGSDMEAVLELYNGNNADRTCSVVRSVECFPTFPKGSSYWGDGASADGFVLEDGGQLVAYAVFDKSRRVVNAIEVESVDPHIYPTLLYELARMAIDQRCGHITLFMPPDHPFTEYAQRYGGEWTSEYPKNGGGMMRIVNQGTLFQKIGSELERRAVACRSELSGAMTIRTDIGTTTLRLADGALRVEAGGQAAISVELSQDKLMQLVAGYRRARDVLNDPGVRLRGDVEPILDALFPKGHPYVWLADLF